MFPLLVSDQRTNYLSLPFSLLPTLLPKWPLGCFTLSGGNHYAELTGYPMTWSLPLPAHSVHEVSTCHKHPVWGAHSDCAASSWQSLCCFAWLARTQAPGLGGGIKQKRTAFSSKLALSHYANGTPGRSSSQGPILHTWRVCLEIRSHLLSFWARSLFEDQSWGMRNC